MNIVIVNAYNRRNAGDAALLSALIGQINEVFPDADVCFASLEDPREHPEFEGVRNLGSIRRWAGDESTSRHRRMCRKMVALGISAVPPRVLAWLSDHAPRAHLFEPSGELAALARADLVVGLGGGYVNGSASVAGTLNVFFVLLPLWLAARLRRPTILAPQSYGPFGRRAQLHLVRTCLNRVDRIVVRETPSLDQLRTAGVHEHLLERGVDSAFALPGDVTAVAADESDIGHPRVAVTVRSWLPGPAQDLYERSMAGFIDWLHDSRNAFVALIPQVTTDYRDDDDRLTSRRVASHCSTTPKLVDSELNHTALRSLYGSFDMVVGTRFHSVIFSLLAGIPAVAVEYEHKASGIMTDLGLGEWVIPIQEVTATRLIERFIALEDGLPEYERRLKERLPDYVSRAQDFVDILRGSVS